MQKNKRRDRYLLCRVLWGENSSICYFHTNLIVLKLLLYSFSVFFVSAMHKLKKGFNFHCHSNVLQVAHEGLFKCLVILTLRPSSSLLGIVCSIGFDHFASQYFNEYARREKGKITRCNRLIKHVILLIFFVFSEGDEDTDFYATDSNPLAIIATSLPTNSLSRGRDNKNDIKK